MKRFFILLAAVLMAVSAMAKSKMTFTVSGPQESYHQIRVINETSMEDLTCRVVIVGENDKVAAVYGTYHLYGKNGSDSAIKRVWRGTLMGVQMPNDFKGDVAFDVEYVSLKLFNIIVIHLRDGEKKAKK